MKTVDCAVFWDIENIPVPKGYFARDVITAIRETILKPNSLKEIDFYCACDLKYQQRRYGSDMASMNATVVQVYNYEENAADNKLMERMRNFLERSKYGSAIVLISGDGDFVESLKQFKETFGVTVYLVHRNKSTSKDLVNCCDEPYSLESILIRMAQLRKHRSQNWYIEVSGFDSNLPWKTVINELRDMSRPFGGNYVFMNPGLAYIRFSDKVKAQQAAARMNMNILHGEVLKVVYCFTTPPQHLLQTKRNNRNPSPATRNNGPQNRNNLTRSYEPGNAGDNTRNQQRSFTRNNRSRNQINHPKDTLHGSNSSLDSIAPCCYCTIS